MNKDIITQAVKESELICTNSCCGVPNKFCNSDVWTGNLESFVNAYLRLAKEYNANQYRLAKE